MKVHQNCLDLEKSALLSQSRQRFIPTFYHQQIFNYQPVQQKLIRCTPTYHSTALNTEGYNIETHHKKTQKERPQTALQSSVYRNNSHEKRVQDLNPHNHACSSSRQSWYDNNKKQLIEDVKRNSHVGYSRCRKIIDLSSDPVFIQYNYGKNQTSQSRKVQKCFVNSTQNCINVNVNDQLNYNNCCRQADKVNIQKELPANTIINQLNVNENQNEKQPKIEESVKNVQPNKNKDNIKAKKDFHKDCVPDYQKKLKLKGKRIGQKQKACERQAKKPIISQNPTFTVIRKNRIGRK